MCRKFYSWNSNTCIYNNSKHLKSVFDDSKVVFDEIINATDSVSVSFDNKKVRYKMDCYIL